MTEFFRSRRQSFRYAFAGWRFVVHTQPNAWIHALVSIAVILLALWLKLTWQGWVFIILAMAMVWIAEFFNTALEAVVDLASHHEQNELARIGKDVGAAAVLMAALASVLIGLFVLGPPLWARIHAWFN
ncbi:MAG: diacylglycerol kinase family protein [Anaerolineaceae bacterium]